MRNATSKALGAADTAANTGANLGGAATGIRGNLTPFLTERMLHPEGYGQQDLSAQTAAAEAGAGGAASGLTGQAVQRAAVTRNAGGYQAALSDIARQRMKGAAGASADIATKNADLKQQQQGDATKELGDLYKIDTSGMLDSQGQVAGDVNAAVNADKQGWLQNSLAILNTINGTGSMASQWKK